MANLVEYGFDEPPNTFTVGTEVFRLKPRSRSTLVVVKVLSPSEVVLVMDKPLFFDFWERIDGRDVNGNVGVAIDDVDDGDGDDEDVNGLLEDGDGFKAVTVDGGNVDDDNAEDFLRMVER